MKPVPNLDKCIGKQRYTMPQIEDFSALSKDLAKNNIKMSDSQDYETDQLTPTQKHFNDDKIKAIIDSNKKIKPIIVSNDFDVIDGHHRWLAAHNTTGIVYANVVDMSTEDLLNFLKDKPYVTTKKLSEEAAAVANTVGSGAISQEPVVRNKAAKKYKNGNFENAVLKRIKGQ